MGAYGNTPITKNVKPFLFFSSVWDPHNPCENLCAMELLNPQVGDILVAKTYSGCSYHHVFAKVIGFTRTNKIRIRPLEYESNCVEHGVLGQLYVVKPTNVMRDGRNICLRPDGTIGTKLYNHKRYEIYSPTTTYNNWSDNGD